jgi:hypothetical protein
LSVVEATMNIKAGMKWAIWVPHLRKHFERWSGYGALLFSVADESSQGDATLARVRELEAEVSRVALRLSMMCDSHDTLERERDAALARVRELEVKFAEQTDVATLAIERYNAALRVLAGLYDALPKCPICTRAAVICGDYWRCCDRHAQGSPSERPLENAPWIREAAKVLGR